VLYPLASQNIVIDLDDGVEGELPEVRRLPLERISGWRRARMTEVATIRPHLERRFADHRVVFSGTTRRAQYAFDLDSLDLPG